MPAGTAAVLVPEQNAFGPASGWPSTLPAAFAGLPPLAPFANAPFSTYQDDHYFTDAEYGSLDLLGDADYKLTDRVTAESIESSYDSIDSGTSSLGFIQTGGSSNLAYRPSPGRLSATEDNVGWAGRVHARYTLAPTHEAFAAVSRGQGFEGTLQGAVNRHLAIFGSYGFTDARFSALDQDGNPQAYAGNTFRLCARHAFSVGGTVTVPAFDRGAFYLSPVFQYKSESYFEDDNARSGGALRQGVYGLVNLTLAYRPRVGFWEAAIYSDNLLDREYLIDAGNLGAAFGIPTTVRGAPRTVGARFTARF